MLGRIEAQVLLQTLTVSFPALKAIHTGEKCVHGSAGGFITGRVPCTWGCQIISDLPHPTPETQPAYSSSSSHLISQVIPYLPSSLPLHYVLPLPANKAPPELCPVAPPPLYPPILFAPVSFLNIRWKEMLLVPKYLLRFSLK